MGQGAWTIRPEANPQLFHSLCCTSISPLHLTTSGGGRQVLQVDGLDTLTEGDLKLICRTYGIFSPDNAVRFPA